MTTMTIVTITNMKPSNDQRTVARVVSQIIKRLDEVSDINDPYIYTYIDEELSTLEEILSPKELNQVRDNINELYLCIKEHKE